MNRSDLLPKALAEALGQVVADIRRDAKRDYDRHDADTRAVIAELRLKLANHEAESRERLRLLVQEEVARAVANLPSAPAGKDADMDVVQALIAEEVQRGVATIPSIKGESGEPGVPGERGPPGEQGIPGEPGKDADMDAVASLVVCEVQKAVAAIPVLKGEPGDVGPSGKDGQNGKDGIDGKDGAGVSGAIIDRDGVLVLTMSDGSIHKMGHVVGKDGKDGIDGKDGVGFEESIDGLADDGRTWVRKYMRNGQVIREVRNSIPALIYRGVWKSDQHYCRGDMVTHQGSLWHADIDNSNRPDPEKGWTLAAKRGRDGRDGVMKPEPVKPVVRIE